LRPQRLDPVPLPRHHIVTAGSGRELCGLTAGGGPAILIILSNPVFGVCIPPLGYIPCQVGKELY